MSAFIPGSGSSQGSYNLEGILSQSTLVLHDLNVEGFYGHINTKCEDFCAYGRWKTVVIA